MKKLNVLFLAIIMAVLLCSCSFGRKPETVQSCSFQENAKTDDYSFWFGLCDSKGRYVSADCTVDIKIVNSKGEKVFSSKRKISAEHFKNNPTPSGQERLMGEVKIDKDDITATSSKSGTVYFTIKGEKFEFEEKQCSVDKCLPYRVDVETLKGWSFQENTGTDDYSLFFGFLDDDGKEVAAACRVKLTIYSDNNEKVYTAVRELTEKDFGYYSSKLEGDRLLANIRIKSEDITPGTSTSGLVYFTVDGDDFAFDEVKCEAFNCLPVKNITLVVDTLPVEIVSKNYGAANDVFRISEVYYTVNTSSYSCSMDITISGEKIAGSSGSLSYGFIGYKIYDSEQYLIDSGMISLGNGLSKGDKFKNSDTRVYGLTPGEEYILVLTEYNFY